MSRHLIQTTLKENCSGYWATRILSQISYLEEYNAAYPQYGYTALLETVTAMANSCYEQDGAITKAAALKIEETLSTVSEQMKKTLVTCVAHAHIDMNWMWRFDETVSITINTFRTMLDLMKEYPDFTFAQSQASVYRIIEEYAPEMLEEIRARIAEKRWEVTATAWVETDKNMPNGESLSRHNLYSKQYLQKLLGLSDDDFRIDFEPDTFGHNANVPEILSRAGIKYYYHCRGYNGHHIYRWRAPSGSEIIVYREPTWYNDTVEYNTFSYIPKFCAANSIDHTLYVYGVGDHGGGATRRDLERITDMMTWPCMPTLKFGRYIDFFTTLDNADLPVVDHELNFIFSGCYTTETRIKKANRTAEAALDETEMLNAASSLLGGYRYDNSKFASCWEKVLFNHFHDILPGSGTTDTREYALGEFQKVMAEAGTRKNFAVRSLSAMINTAKLLPVPDDTPFSVSEGAGVGFGVENFGYSAASHTRGISRLFNLFNPSQYNSDMLSTVTVWDWQGNTDYLSVCDENGSELEFQLLDKTPQHYWGHHYFRLLVNAAVPAYGYRTIMVRQLPTKSPFIVADYERTKDPAHHVLENDYIRAVFDMHTTALISLFDKTTSKEMIDPAKGTGSFRYIEESPGYMTSWIVERYMHDEALTEGITISNVVSGPLRSSFTFSIPVRASKIELTVSLDKNSRMVEFDTKCSWREFGIPDKVVPQLGYRLPLAANCENYQYDIPFGIINRPSRDDDVPALSFAYTNGVMLCSDSKYGFRGANDALYIDLIRSAYNPDTTPEAYDHHIKFFIGIPKSDSADSLMKTTRLHNHPITVVDAASHEGKLDLSGSFMNVSDAIVVSSVKLAEDGSNDLIIRAWNDAACSNKASVTLAFTPKAAYLCDTYEKVAAPISVSGNTISLEVAAKASFTLRISF